MPYTLIHGVDCSHYEVTIDMHLAQSAGIRFWAEKVSEGLSADPLFVSDARQARMRSVFDVRLYYHFCHCDGVDAAQQGQFFASSVGSIESNEYAAFDVEQSWGSLTGEAGVNYLIDVIEAAQQQLGIGDDQVIIYGSLGWLRGQFGDALSMLAARFHLWAARYGVTDLGDTSAWSAALIWQYGEFGNVAGIGQGCVDTDIWLDGHWPIAEAA